eukprot:6374113-Pyramimonas_sp.AAC.1
MRSVAVSYLLLSTGSAQCSTLLPDHGLPLPDFPGNGAPPVARSSQGDHLAVLGRSHTYHQCAVFVLSSGTGWSSRHPAPPGPASP